MTADSNVASLAVRDDPEVTSTALIRPAADLQTIKEAFDEYQRLRMQLLDEGDFQQIQGKKHPKKSAWRKLSTAFGVSLSIVSKEHVRDGDGRILYSEFVCRATASNGRSVEGWGLCHRNEKCCEEGCTKKGNHRHCPRAEGKPCSGERHFSHMEHDIPATAETRAKNRAASDLFGMGEVSAEEILSPGEVHAPGSDYIEGEVVEERPARQPSQTRPAGDVHALRNRVLSHPKWKTMKSKSGWGPRDVSKAGPDKLAQMLAELEGKPAAAPPPAPAAEPVPAEAPEVDWTAERQVAELKETIEAEPGWKDKYEAIYGAVVEAAVMGTDPDSLNDVLAHMRAESAQPAEVVEQ